MQQPWRAVKLGKLLIFDWVTYSRESREREKGPAGAGPVRTGLIN
jgi:hypothetical protein